MKVLAPTSEAAKAHIAPIHLARFSVYLLLLLLLLVFCRFCCYQAKADIGQISLRRIAIFEVLHTLDYIRKTISPRDGYSLLEPVA